MMAPTAIQRNLGAAALLALASVFAVYQWHFMPKSQASQGLQTLSEMLRLEAIALPVKAPEGGTKGRTIPELLSAIQEAAMQTQVTVSSVTPDPVDPQKLTLGIRGEFRDVMLFLGKVETFQIVVGAFDLAPGKDSGLDGTIELRLSGKPGAPTNFTDYLDAIVKYTAIRNPFEIGTPVPLPHVTGELGDLSWTYHLTSISLYGGIRVATIDGKDYRAGESFQGMQISAIGPSSVSLIAPGQKLVQKLHFRNNPNGRSL